MDLKLKKKRLDDISDEVGELHPILERLFGKLPNIKSVKNTHGQKEFGADFILTQEDPSLGFINYIGVVVKAEQIKQGHADVDRQIGECQTIQRQLEVGKKNIYFNEIWVVSSGNITGNAENSLRAKYFSANLKFIPQDILIVLIDKHLDEFWTPVSIEVGTFITVLRKRNEAEDIRLSLIEGENKKIYLEQDIYKYEEEGYSGHLQRNRRQPTETKVNISEIIESKKIAIVQGEFGSGKSKLFRHIVEMYADPEVFHEKKVLPVLTSYKELVIDYGLDFSRLLNDKLGGNWKAILDETESPLFLIDGLEELNLSAVEQIAQIESIIETLSKSQSFTGILSTRLINAAQELSKYGTQVQFYELRPLNLNRLIEFIRQICSSTRITTRLLEDLKNSQLVKQIPRNPIAAILLAKLLNEQSVDLPSNITELYSKYVELVLGRWDIVKGFANQKEYEAIESFMMDIAEYMHDNKLPHLSIEEAKRRFETYLTSRNLQIDQTRAFEIILDRCEILSVDTNRLCFKHVSFAEFFYAKKMFKDRNLAINDRVFHPYWINVYFFYVGLHCDCPDLLNKIFAIRPQSEAEQLLFVANSSSYLLAGYRTPYTVIEAHLTSVILEAAKLYVETTEKKRQSSFTGSSKLFFLLLIQVVIRGGYQYSFFERALETVALNIEDSHLDKKIKIFAQFLVSILSAEFGNTAPFDFLIDNYEVELPIELKLAIGVEGKKPKIKSKLVKGLEKSMKRMLKDDPTVLKRLIADVDKPIKHLKSIKSPEV